MLRNAEVRRVDFAHVDAVARCDERVEQVDDPLALVASEESFHILEQERLRSVTRHEVGENGNEGVAHIARAAFAGGREPLAGRPADDDVHFWQHTVPMQILEGGPMREVQAIALRGGPVAVRRVDDATAGGPQTGAQTACAAE